MTTKLAVAIFTPLWLAGCFGKDIAAYPAFASDQCKAAGKGVAEVTFDDLAKIRGAKLLDANVDTAGTRLFVISRGRKATPGHGISLVGVRRRGDVLQISVQADEPEQGTMLPQVLTSPCLVVAVDEAAFADTAPATLVVTDQSNRNLGTLPLATGG